MLNVEEFPSRDGQGARVCTGIVLLIICMMLAHVQDGKQAAALERAARRPREEPNWIHSSLPCTASVSRIAFFSAKADETFISWQVTRNTNSSELVVADSFSSQYDMESGQGFWSSMRSDGRDGPVHDSSLHTAAWLPSNRSSLLQVIPFYGDSCVTEETMCFAALQTLGPRDCAQMLWLNQDLSDSKPSPYDCLFRQASSCNRLLLSDSLSNLARLSDTDILPADMVNNSFASAPFCMDVAPSTLAFDASGQELLFLSKVQRGGMFREDFNGTDPDSFCLWSVPLLQQPIKLSDSCYPLPEIDEAKMLEHLIDLRQRLGQAGREPEIRVISNPHPVTDPKEKIEPLLLFPSSVGNHLSVLKTRGSGGSKKLLVSILDRTDSGFVLKSSVQFDNMGVSWVLDAPSSEAQDYLLLLGSAPPYAWQVEAINLNTGTIQVRSSLAML